MPSSHVRSPARILRAGAAAVAMVSLAAGAHLFGGGALPAAPVLLGVVALAGLAVTLATRFRLGFPALAALLGVGQFALHEAFTAFSLPVSGQTPGGGPASGLITSSGLVSFSAAHHAAPALVDHTLVDHALDAGAHLHSLGSPLSLVMLAGHAAATAATALLLARGEDALWQLAAWLRPLIRLPRPPFCPVATPLSSRTPERFFPRPWRNLRQDSRRGPPTVVVLS